MAAKKLFTQIFIYFSKPLRLLYSLIIYEIVNFSFFALYSLLLLSFFLYLKSVPIYVIIHVPPIVGRHLYMYIHYVIVLYMCIHVVLYMFIVVRRTLTFACISLDLSLTLVLSGRAHGTMTRSRWPFARRSSPPLYRASRGMEQSPSAHQSLN